MKLSQFVGLLILVAFIYIHNYRCEKGHKKSSEAGSHQNTGETEAENYVTEEEGQGIEVNDEEDLQEGENTIPDMNEFLKTFSKMAGGGKDFKMEDIPLQFFVSTKLHFPNAPFKQLTSGEISDVLIGIHNTHKEPITVFGISGGYYSPDFSQLYRNLTQSKYWNIVGPQEQMTILYKIKPEMEPCTLGLIIQVDFTDVKEKTWNKIIAFNSTIAIVPPIESAWDMESIFIYALLIVLVVGLGYLVKTTFLKSSSSSGSRKSKYLSTVGGSFPKIPSDGSSNFHPSHSNTSASSVEARPASEWIPEHHHQRRSMKLKK